VEKKNSEMAAMAGIPSRWLKAFVTGASTVCPANESGEVLEGLSSPKKFGWRCLQGLCAKTTTHHLPCPAAA